MGRGGLGMGEEMGNRGRSMDYGKRWEKRKRRKRGVEFPTSSILL